MSFFHLILYLFCSLLVCTLGSSSTFLNQATSASQSVRTPLHHESNTDHVIDSCSTDSFICILEAIPSERNNKCRVTIKKNNRSAIAEKELILDVPIDRSSINYCTQEYAVIGFACGGPCSSRIFIFSDKREPTQLSYCRRVKNNDNLVTHIQNEEFDDLIIHNLKNGKELIVNNPDIDWMQYGQMDTLVFSNDSLYMEYLNENGGTTKKTISISEILN